MKKQNKEDVEKRKLKVILRGDENEVTKKIFVTIATYKKTAQRELRIPMSFLPKEKPTEVKCLEIRARWLSDEEHRRNMVLEYKG